jgi:hypothetical protein
MINKEINFWRATIMHTLDVDYNTVLVSEERAKLLVKGIKEGKFYYLTIEAGFDIEIVKVVDIKNKNILVIERGQQGTGAGIWPAGTLLEGRISAQAIDDLHLDPKSIMDVNKDAMVAPNGDLITKLS